MKILVTKNIHRLDTKNYTLEDIRKEVNECFDILRYYGFKPGTVIDIKWLNSTNVLGRTLRNTYNTFSMFFNKKYFEIETPENIHNTIMHECIHCIPGCFNHQTDFKYVASVVNSKLEFKISRTSNATIFENYVINNSKNKYKYQIVCNNCGAQLEKMVRKSQKYQIIIAGNKSNSSNKHFLCPHCHSINLSIVDL